MYSTSGATCTPMSCTAGPTVVPTNSAVLLFVPCSRLVTGQTCSAGAFTCSAGYTPLGSFTLVCDDKGKYDPAGASCRANVCAGGLAPPEGAVLSGGATAAALATGDGVAALLAVAAGYSCSGAPTALCATAGTQPAAVSGYSCVPFVCTGGLLAPAHSAERYRNVSAASGADVTYALRPVSAGYSCRGTAVATCTTPGAHPAAVSGLSCTPNVCMRVAPPAGAEFPEAVNTSRATSGQRVEPAPTAARGWMCSGVAEVLCAAPGGTASVAGLTCTPRTCTAALAAPSGAQVAPSAAAPSPRTTGDRLLASALFPQPGWVCSGDGTVVCPEGATAAEVTGVRCAPRICAAPGDASLLPFNFSGGRACTTVPECGTVSCAPGWVPIGGAAPPPAINCTAEGVFVASGCRALGCIGPLPIPENATAAAGVSLSYSSGADVTRMYAPASASHICTGAAVVRCTAGGAVTVSGMSCRLKRCAGVSGAPLGSAPRSPAVAVSTGAAAQSVLSAAPGWTCGGAAVARCVAEGGLAALEGAFACRRNQCLPLPAELAQGYALRGGPVCTGTPERCGPASCAAGFSGSAALSCPADRGPFAAAGCLANRCEPGDLLRRGYRTYGGARCATVSQCGTVSCAQDYFEASVPALTCLSSGEAFGASGCSSCTGWPGTCPVAAAPGPAAPLPRRAWQRLRLALQSAGGAPADAAAKLAFAASVQAALRRGAERLRSGAATLAVTLVCWRPAGSSCCAPQCWRPTDEVAGNAAARSGGVLQSGGTAQTEVVVADDTEQLLSGTVAELAASVQSAWLGDQSAVSGLPPPSAPAGSAQVGDKVRVRAAADPTWQEGTVVGHDPAGLPLVATPGAANATVHDAIEPLLSVLSLQGAAAGVADGVSGGPSRGVADGGSDDPPWWAWVIIAAGGALILALCVLLVVLVARRCSGGGAKSQPDDLGRGGSPPGAKSRGLPFAEVPPHWQQPADLTVSAGDAGAELRRLEQEVAELQAQQRDLAAAVSTPQSQVIIVPEGASLPGPPTGAHALLSPPSRSARLSPSPPVGDPLAPALGPGGEQLRLPSGQALWRQVRGLSVGSEVLPAPQPSPAVSPSVAAGNLAL